MPVLAYDSGTQSTTVSTAPSCRIQIKASGSGKGNEGGRGLEERI